jgi:hypothetical protein
MSANPYKNPENNNDMNDTEKKLMKQNKIVNYFGSRDRKMHIYTLTRGKFKVH